ncbi:tRNA 2-selenouridine(34) synthase MnmH [Sulfurospirillum sp. T05]|uniref:tRNA 2-selenouridine(34) synthase MnmH n=1 Tax=Sulfurospirillum tamanense TaxID=2813362 RepID=A0ABS2WTV0_9BACT|nr:tRNA 2-selenouridine(34) synthase MnmH [Sulfurospirillum tamanensis]MBN2964614.1 tRNA 2-selenouridine(34) synthase MnmH [Sulfurospirillum tamanensis]
MRLIEPEAFFETYAQYDLIIDARSPSEFATSHFPTAHNFFALDDTQRHEVGCVYKQESKFRAKALGAGYICANVSTHLASIYTRVPPGGKIALYCARGGLRSASFGLILDQIGYRVDRVKNGYKGIRNVIVALLEEPTLPPFITLFGNTGCGKTELLQHLSPVIDLEALAEHKGSVFGRQTHTQPSTKMFQNLLACAIKDVEKAPFCFIEGESKRIGKLMLPSSLYHAMYQGKKVRITAPLKDRIARIKKEYEAIDAPFFYYALDKISRFISKETKRTLCEAFDKGDLDTVVSLLLTEYYDKIYKYHHETIALENDSTCIEKLHTIGRAKWATSLCTVSKRAALI